VLPFFDTGKDTLMAGVFDQMTEDVITNIGQLSHGTKVISFNGVVGYKEKSVTPIRAGEELGVDAVIACRVYKQGNDYSLRLEVVNVHDNTQIGNQKFSSSLSELTMLPKRMAAAIIRSYGGSVTDSQAEVNSRRQTANIDAYRLYQKGYTHYNRWWKEVDLRLSLDYYRKALKLDPQYALAHGGIALSYAQLAGTGCVPLAQIKDSVVAAANLALGIDSKLPEAHLALTLLKYSDFEPAASIEGAFEQTIALNPSYADAVHFYAHWLSETRKPERAIEMMLRSVEHEPLNPHFQNCVGIAYGQARRWQESQAAFKKLFEMDSTYWTESSDTFLHNNAFVRGDTAGVINYYTKWIAQIPGDSLMCRAVINAYLGRISLAKESVNKLNFAGRPSWVRRHRMSVVNAALKDKVETIRWLEAMYENRDPVLMWVNTDPNYDFLIGDLRFEALMKKAGYRD
jgi:TolB-like protein